MKRIKLIISQKRNFVRGQSYIHMTFSSTEFPINYSPKVATESKFLVKYKPISSRRHKPAYKFNKRISQSIMKHQKKKGNFPLS